MKIPDPITWTCEVTGTEVKFIFRGNAGWCARFPSNSLKDYSKMAKLGIKLPWPPVPEEWKESIEEFKKQMSELTGYVHGR